MVDNIKGTTSVIGTTVVKNNGSSNDNPYNLVRVERAENIPQESSWFGLQHKLATAGYSAAPEGYEAETQIFLNSLVHLLGGAGSVGLVTSPTADKGSIDAISTTAASLWKLPLKYVTAEGYVKYINPDNFPKEGIDLNRYQAEPKFVLPTNEEYSRATSVVSNSLLVTGGRDATVGDFVNAIKQGNKVVILDNQLVKASVWDEKKNRPNNASLYLAQMIEGNTELPFIPSKGFTKEFLEENKEAIASLVKVIRANSRPDTLIGAMDAADFLKR